MQGKWFWGVSEAKQKQKQAKTKPKQPPQKKTTSDR